MNNLKYRFSSKTIYRESDRKWRIMKPTFMSWRYSLYKWYRCGWIFDRYLSESEAERYI